MHIITVTWTLWQGDTCLNLRNLESHTCREKLWSLWLVVRNNHKSLWENSRELLQGLPASRYRGGQSHPETGYYTSGWHGVNLGQYRWLFLVLFKLKYSFTTFIWNRTHTHWQHVRKDEDSDELVWHRGFSLVEMNSIADPVTLNKKVSDHHQVHLDISLINFLSCFTYNTRATLFLFPFLTSWSSQLQLWPEKQKMLCSTTKLPCLSPLLYTVHTLLPKSISNVVGGQGNMIEQLEQF